ncbi:MAG: extracellular solute-binding protein [Bifidobacterium psychraerophilum]|uniref:extracellular solute-binding protein n=1 Tax=Bifidobacterium psychraerophilum TaxID=218140 RepID=UPI0039E7F428
MRIKRVLSAIAGVMAVAALTTGCGVTSSAGSDESSSASTDKGTVTVFISGDTNVQDLWEKGLIPAFNKQYPNITVKTEIDLHGEHDQQTVAKLATSVKAGEDPGYQLVDAGWVTGQGAKANLLEKATESNISNLSDVPSATVKAGQKVGIPYRASSVLLAYDSTKVENPPKTLKGLLSWIVKHPGQFAYNSPSSGGSGGAFVSTVLDSYLTKEQQSTLRLKKDATAEAAWKQGFEKLASLNPYVYQKGVYPNGNTQVLTMLGQGTIEMAPVWSDQFITAQKSGTIPSTVKYTQISDPSFTGSASYLGVPKTASNKKTVYKLVDFVLSVAGQKVIADQVSGYPVISLDKMDKSVAEKFKDADISSLRAGYYSEVSSDMNNQWDQLVPGQQ